MGETSKREFLSIWKNKFLFLFINIIILMLKKHSGILKIYKINEHQNANSSAFENKNVVFPNLFEMIILAQHCCFFKMNKSFKK